MDAGGPVGRLNGRHGPPGSREARGVESIAVEPIAGPAQISGVSPGTATGGVGQRAEVEVLGHQVELRVERLAPR